MKTEREHFDEELTALPSRVGERNRRLFVVALKGRTRLAVNPAAFASCQKLTWGRAEAHLRSEVRGRPRRASR